MHLVVFLSLVLSLIFVTSSIASNQCTPCLFAAIRALILRGLVKCELRVASYELQVAPVLRVASCELVVKSASWYI